MFFPCMRLIAEQKNVGVLKKNEACLHSKYQSKTHSSTDAAGISL